MMSRDQMQEKTMRAAFTMALLGLAGVVMLSPPVLAEDAVVPSVKFAPPRDADIVKHAQAPQILLGKRLLSETKRLLPNNVGDGLNCTSCHLGEGKVAFASPYVGVSTNFPQYAPRAGREISLAERINGCFLRSLNGKPVPVDSPDMKAMLAYFEWLSTGLPAKAKVDGRGIGKIDSALVPDPVHGKAVYDASCANCHGAQGEGMKDARGEFVFPPLWGDQSFNIGAGMARTYTAATFVKHNMPVAWGVNAPLGQGGQITDQEAVDVAEYFTHQPRPDFPAKVKDWPNGGKPKDARY
jgi:thiosulfate dehydrogenase